MIGPEFFREGDEAEAELRAEVAQLQAENERLRDFIAKMERGYKHFRDTAEAEYTRLHAEIEQLRMVTAPGSCECSPEEACRYARERDDARAEIERLRGQVTQRGARMQLMHGYMWSYSGSGTTLWNDFCRVIPDATKWFDTHGVPK